MAAAGSSSAQTGSGTVKLRSNSEYSSSQYEDSPNSSSTRARRGPLVKRLPWDPPKAQTKTDVRKQQSRTQAPAPQGTVTSHVPLTTEEKSSGSFSSKRNTSAVNATQKQQRVQQQQAVEESTQKTTQQSAHGSFRHTSQQQPHATTQTGSMRATVPIKKDLPTSPPPEEIDDRGMEDYSDPPSAGIRNPPPPLKKQTSTTQQPSKQTSL